MAVNYNFRRGIDLPSWHWLSPVQAGNTYHGTACAYDGSRYMYWAMQVGSTGAVSTTVLWRFDTWTNGWQYLTNITNSYTGLDMEFDSVRNVLYIINGNGATTLQIFNLNRVPVTVMNQTVPAWSLATSTIALPATANTGSSLTAPDELNIPAAIDNGIADTTGQTTTNVKATDATGTFGQGMVGLQLRITSGTQSGQMRSITAVTDKNNLTVAPAITALTGAETFVIELPTGTATAGSTTTLTQGSAAYIVNAYANQDVIITAGTGVGQRRRIASNTATVLTLSAAVTGNARTGPFTTAPDTTSVFRIVPSSDFMYYQNGGGTGLYRIDLVQTTGTAWSSALAAVPAATGGGANTFYPYAYSPFQFMCLRGSGTSTLYSYNMGTNVWTTLTTYGVSETFNTGATGCMLHGKRKLFVQKESSARCYAYNLLTGELEPFGVMPYANPAGYDGKRAKMVRTTDGVEWLYLQRSGGQEFYRVALEWL